MLDEINANARRRLVSDDDPSLHVVLESLNSFYPFQQC
jgi:hypothetical protein